MDPAVPSDVGIWDPSTWDTVSEIGITTGVDSPLFARLVVTAFESRHWPNVESTKPQLIACVSNVSTHPDAEATIVRGTEAINESTVRKKFERGLTCKGYILCGQETTPVRCYDIPAWIQSLVEIRGRAAIAGSSQGLQRCRDLAAE